MENQLVMFFFTEVIPEQLVYDCNEYLKSVPQHTNRQQFFDDALKMDGVRLFNKYFPLSLRYKIKYIVRRLIIKTPFYGKIKAKYKKQNNR